MALYEWFPFTNEHGMNFDWLLKAIKELRDRVDEERDDLDALTTRVQLLETDVNTLKSTVNNHGIRITALENNYTSLASTIAGIESSITTINNDLINIHNQIDGIDLTEIENAITNNNIQSINRDNALSARIGQLERATLHDIYNYYSEANKCIFGSDLRHMPNDILDSDGYPIVGWANKTNANEQGTSVERLFKFGSLGLEVNQLSSSYDYFQVGMYSNGLYLNGYFTVTLALINADDATPTWYKHTFSSYTDQWTIASNCIIKMRKFYNWNNPATNHLHTLSFMGTGANWSTFLGNNKIAFIFVENGTGSIDTTSNAKPEYNIKDREYFVSSATPTPELSEANIVGTGSGTANATYYDLVGEPQTVEIGITLTVTAKKYGKVVDGYVNVRMDLRNNIGNILARGITFTLTGVALSYDGENLPLPNSNSSLRGVANDSKYYEWPYNNTQNTYVFINIADNGTWNVKAISSGMQNYTGDSLGYTDLRVPLHYIA